MKITNLLHQLAQNSTLYRSNINFIRFTYTKNFIPIDMDKKQYSYFKIRYLRLDEETVSKFAPSESLKEGNQQFNKNNQKT